MDLENPKMMMHIRRDIARLNTILREREMAGGSAEPTGQSEESAGQAEESAGQSEESTE